MNQLTEVAEINISYHPIKSLKPQIVTSLDAFTELFPFYSQDLMGLQEEFLVMYLNRANRILGVYKLSKGGITGTVADTRIILGVALKTAACSIILSHNHPSGSLKPSQADIQITEQIAAAAKFMDLKVVDHLIVTPERKYFSFADDNLIN